MGQEEQQRENPRLHVSAYTTDARIGDRQFRTNLHELGEGGALISTEDSGLAVGDVVQLAYPIPGSPDLNWIAARVVRASVVDGRSHFGVEHQPTDDDSRVALRELVIELVLHPHFEDRRAGSRLAVRAPVTVDGAQGTLEEVALGGLLVTTEARLAKGQRAEIVITFADGIAESFPVEVVHAEQLVREAAPPQYRAGVVIVRDAAYEGGDDVSARVAHVVNRLLTPTWWRKRTKRATGSW